MPEGWMQEEGRFVFDQLSAERAADDGAFVITSFGPDPDADRVFAAIQDAMRFGMIRLRVTPETKATIKQLTGDGRIKCARTVGTAHEELGVIAVKRG
jgi:hypothetical protein